MKRILFLLCGSCFLLSGAVFDLRPGRAAGEAGKWAALEGRLSALVFSENVTVNGIDCRLECFCVEIPLSQLREELGIAGNGSTIRLSRPGRGGLSDRYLLVRSGEKTQIFRLTVPDKLPPPDAWPEELLPLPAGAVPTEIIRFSKRGAVCGLFRNAAQTGDVLIRNWILSAASRKFIPVENGSVQPSGSGRGGDLFLRKKPAAILWATADEKGNGIIYYRPRGNR